MFHFVELGVHTGSDTDAPRICRFFPVNLLADETSVNDFIRISRTHNFIHRITYGPEDLRVECFQKLFTVSIKKARVMTTQCVPSARFARRLHDSIPTEGHAGAGHER